MESYFLRIQLIGNIRWLVQHNHKPTYELKFSDEYELKLVNPNFYGKFINEDDYFMHFVTKKGIIIECSLLIFHVYGNKNLEQFDGENDFLKLFLEHIRFLGNQVTLELRRPVSSHCVTNVNKLKRIVPISAKITPILASKRFSKVYFDWRNCKALKAGLATKESLPVYMNILLDALQALYLGDYRKTIIYSAIATESMLAITLDEANEKNILNRSNEHRQAKTFVDKKEKMIDPIYKKLSNQTSFSNLLHERPLYTIKKSLLVENEKLYKNAISLYSTRNKIVHLGDVPESKDLFSIDESGAIKAYNTSVQIFTWRNINSFTEYE